MKKQSRKQWERDVREGIIFRKRGRAKLRDKSSGTKDISWRATNRWIDSHANSRLNVDIDKRRRITLSLPERMNFFTEYESTVLHISAIRKLASKRRLPRRAYKLGLVNFDQLKSISTSAALVLTAELSKWDDSLRQKLRPMVNNWDRRILQQFVDLGFFDLFHNCVVERPCDEEYGSTSLNLVRYIKGRCGDSDKARVLKRQLIEVVGDKINKWTFLHGGLTEAITNVSHHAYPDHKGYSARDKNWYLTGSFDEASKDLKIVFYDQGIGIPRSLPASAIWERALDILSKFPIAERKRDEVLLRAAVEIDRTSTGKSDRGKGLQDLLEFIRQRKNGYLSILSMNGLFKFSMNDGEESIKTEHFENPICGTLIIWNAKLQN